MQEKREPDEIETVTKYGGGLQWWVPLKLSIERTVTKRWQARANTFGESVTAAADMSAEEIGQRVDQDERVGDLLDESMSRAVRTSDKGYIEGLARLVGAGLRDDAKIDEVSYLLSILTQLEPVHLRVLRTFADLSAQQVAAQGPSTGDSVTEMVLVDLVAPVLGLERFIAVSCAERLVSFSLLADTWHGDKVIRTKPDGTADLDGSFELYRPTEMAQLLLAHCDEILRDEGQPD